ERRRGGHDPPDDPCADPLPGSVIDGEPDPEPSYGVPISGFDPSSVSTPPSEAAPVPVPLLTGCCAKATPATTAAPVAPIATSRVTPDTRRRPSSRRATRPDSPAFTALTSLLAVNPVFARNLGRICEYEDELRLWPGEESRGIRSDR